MAAYNPIIGGLTNKPVGVEISGSSAGIQGGSGASLGSGGNAVQGGATAGNIQQANGNPTNIQTTGGNGVLGASTTANLQLDPAAVAAAASAAKAGALRDQITQMVNSIKDIFNSRYGQVDASAQDQVGKLNTRFGTESQNLTDQIGDQNNQIGAAAASGGTFDSSYRGNNVDTSTKAGNAQIGDLGQELQDNVAQIAQWVASQKAGLDANKGGFDQVLAHLNDETNPDNLVALRNQIDSQIATIKGASADNNTAAQNAGALDSIAPSSARTVQLKTTLSSILGGNADSSQKAAIGAKLIQSAGLSADEQQKLAQAFQSDLASTDPAQQKQQTA